MENREIQQTSNNTELELAEVLTKAETEFGLSEVFQKYGISKNEPITVEFRCGTGFLLCSQRRYVDLSNVQCCWAKAEEQSLENKDIPQTNKNTGMELAEVLNKAELLSSLKNVLRRQGISEKETVTVKFRRGDGVELNGEMQCPCPGDPDRCCQVL